MNLLQQTTLKDFFLQAFNIKTEEMLENSTIDVSGKNIKILSFNHKTLENELKLVKKLIRKQDSIKFIVNNNLECSGKHRLFIKLELNSEGFYLEVKDIFKLKNFYVQNEDKSFILGKIIKTSEKMPVYDMEVEDNHNFYTDNILSHNSYGNPFIEPAGEAMKYLQALKIEISKSLDKDSNKEVFGTIVKGKITKSKVCKPYGEFEYYLELGKGIMPYYEIMNLSIDNEIITKTGNTYSWKELKLGVGQKQLEDFLQDNPEVLEEIKKELLTILEV